MYRKTLVIVACVALLPCLSVESRAEDKVSGKRIYDSICSECHERNYFMEEDAEQVKRTIAKVASGAIKHKKKFRLSEAEVAAIAAYLTSAD